MMKRILAILCAVVMLSVLLCGCDEKEEKKVSDELATLATEVKENVDSMIDDGTVRDGDGYIDEAQQPTTPGENPATEAADPTDPVDVIDDDPDDGDVFDTDPTEMDNVL